MLLLACLLVLRYCSWVFADVDLQSWAKLLPVVEVEALGTLQENRDKWEVVANSPHNSGGMGRMMALEDMEWVSPSSFTIAVGPKKA